MRVLVAMSGGVDSATVAALLHAEGHEVIGATLQLYDQGAASGRKGSCCAGADVHDARRVADGLGIPHYVIDAEARFAEAVIRDFADTYAAGATPVPCVRCNQHLKFGDLLRLARDLGAEAMATGHYVRRIEGSTGPELHRARDEARDQSWFLFATTREQLAFARFPLGEFASKAEVRTTAARLGLSVAAKPDSQDICFAPNGKYAAIAGRLHPEALAAGEIVNRRGQVVGCHQGIARYTVGQSRRLGAAGMIGGIRYAVFAIDAAKRRIIVAPRGEGTNCLRLTEVNWLAAPSSWPLRVSAKLRAREAPQPAYLIEAGETTTRIALESPAAAAPGQACVLYDGSRMLGGGFITAAG